MSRRERPVFVASLRQQNFTQQEIANLVGKSQPSISQYEKQYKAMVEKKDTPLGNQSTEPAGHK
jgi:predicted transcriptional regulator